MLYNQTTGNWLDVNDELDGKRMKFVTECVQTPSDKFKNDDGSAKMTNLVKVRVEGGTEPVNMRPNWTSIGALRDAFGPDSKEWINKVLIARVKDATTGQSVYLLPEGFELYRNEEKRWAIRKTGVAQAEPTQASGPEEPVIDYPVEDINPDDITFD